MTDRGRSSTDRRANIGERFTLVILGRYEEEIKREERAR